MITSKQIFNLLEDWVKDINIYGEIIPIYKNPTSFDITAMIKFALDNRSRKLIEVRFVADSQTKIVYVWDAYLATHNDVIKHLPDFSKGRFEGVSRFDSGKLVFYYSDSLKPSNSSIKRDIFNHDWTWLDKYILKSSEYIDYVRSIVR